MARSIKFFIFSILFFLAGCATETSEVIIPKKLASSSVIYSGEKIQVAVGKFDNRSGFFRGLFSDSIDRLGGQAKTILITHLHQSNRFNVMDRDNMAETLQESNISGKKQNLKAGDFILIGDVTEFGRKEVGDQQLFGILGRGKKQIAYSKVSINVVDATTSEVIFSVQGAGEYTLSSREIIGFGGKSSYDSTLNGKVLDLAIQESVNRLAEAIDSGALRLGVKK